MGAILLKAIIMMSFVDPVPGCGVVLKPRCAMLPFSFHRSCGSPPALQQRLPSPIKYLQAAPSPKRFGTSRRERRRFEARWRKRSLSEQAALLDEIRFATST